MILDLLTENEGPFSLVTYYSRYIKKAKIALGTYRSIDMLLNTYVSFSFLFSNEFII